MHLPVQSLHGRELENTFFLFLRGSSIKGKKAAAAKGAAARVFGENENGTERGTAGGKESSDPIRTNTRAIEKKINRSRYRTVFFLLVV